METEPAKSISVRCACSLPQEIRNLFFSKTGWSKCEQKAKDAGAIGISVCVNLCPVNTPQGNSTQGDRKVTPVPLPRLNAALDSRDGRQAWRDGRQAWRESRRIQAPLPVSCVCWPALSVSSACAEAPSWGGMLPDWGEEGRNSSPSSSRFQGGADLSTSEVKP